MVEHGSGPLRPPVKTGPEKASAFAVLLDLAVRDPEAGEGLALAYAGFTEEERRSVVDAVVADGRAAAVPIQSVLALLLSVERDASVARAIASALTAEPGSGFKACRPVRALLAGDEADGALRLVRPLHGEYLETLELRWQRDKGITRAVFEPLATEHSPQRDAETEIAGLRFEEVPLPFAIDRATTVLWEHRKGIGPLRAALEPFADLFSLQVRPSG